MAICYLLFHFALFLSGQLNGYSVHGARELVNHLHVVKMKSLVPDKRAAEQLQGLQRTHGPGSQLGQEDSSLQDESRVRFLNQVASNRYHIDDLDGKTNQPLPLDHGNYLVTVGLGKPKRDFRLILDTGSDLTWVKCQSCSMNCTTQQGSIYDPSLSSSFSKASCSGSCEYNILYNDSSYSRGNYVKDTLSLSPSEEFPNFVFGCGQDYSKDGFGEADGVLGMGSGALSFLAQTASTQSVAQIFCYCLPVKESSDGYLLFGEEALSACQTNTFTPLMSSSKGNQNFYFVKLNGITFGSQSLPVSSSLSTILDSGTVITRLPPAVFSPIKSAFQKVMSKYSPAPASGLLDTCYNVPDGEVNSLTMPKVALQFEKTEVELHPSAVVWRDTDSRVCLAFIGNKNPGDLIVIGNHQQRGVNILYDIQEGKVEFGVGRCSN